MPSVELFAKRDAGMALGGALGGDRLADALDETERAAQDACLHLRPGHRIGGDKAGTTHLDRLDAGEPLGPQV
ncbi:hypothetical protein D3C72_1801280 [compost metagenome]